MRISDFDALSMRSGLDTMTKSQRVEAHVLTISSCSACDGDDVSCTTCGGDGTVSTDTVSYLQGRVQWRDPGELRMATGGVIAAGEMGDVQLHVGLPFKAVLTTVRDGDGYLVIDGEKVKPFSVRERRVEKGTLLDVRANIVGQPRTT